MVLVWLVLVLVLVAAERGAGPSLADGVIDGTRRDPCRGVRVGEASHPGPGGAPAGNASGPGVVPLGSAYVSAVGDRGRVLQVLAFRVLGPGQRAGDGSCVLAVPAREDEDAFTVAAREPFEEGGERRQLRVTFTRVGRIGKRTKASAATVAGARSWALDPADGFEPAWLPSAEALRVAAEQWLAAQPPDAGADAPAVGDAVPPVQRFAPAAPAPAGGAPAAVPAPAGDAPGAAPAPRPPGDPLREWSSLAWWDDVDYESESRRPTVTTKGVPRPAHAAVAAGKARVLTVLDRATQALQALERHVAGFHGEGAAVPADFLASLAEVRVHE